MTSYTDSLLFTQTALFTQGPEKEKIFKRFIPNFFMNPEVLGGLLKRAYPSFSMNTFENRFRLQKFVYLLQEYGLNLGYNYSLYLHGPYSTEVAKNGFQIENYDSLAPRGFIDPYEKKFQSFLSFFRKYKTDDAWLEIASTICMLITLYPSFSKEDIFQKLLTIKKIDKTYANKVWNDLVGGGFFAEKN